MLQKKVAVKNSSKEKCSRRKLQCKVLRRRNVPKESCSEKFFEGEMFQKKIAVKSSSKEKCSRRKLHWKILRRRNVPEESCSEKFFEGEMFRKSCSTKFFEGEMFQKKVAVQSSSKEKCSRRKLQWKKHFLCSIIFFPEDRAGYEIMQNIMVQPIRPQMTI